VYLSFFSPKLVKPVLDESCYNIAPLNRGDLALTRPGIDLLGERCTRACVE